MECLIIGRDLVRLLQNVARIPEMELVWKDLLHNPQVLSPQFTGKTTLPTILSSLSFKAGLRTVTVLWMKQVWLDGSGAQSWFVLDFTHSLLVSTLYLFSDVCFRCSPAPDGSDLQEVSGLSSHT